MGVGDFNGQFLDLAVVGAKSADVQALGGGSGGSTMEIYRNLWTPFNGRQGESGSSRFQLRPCQEVTNLGALGLYRSLLEESL